MSKTTRIIVALVVVAVIAGGAVLVLSRNDRQGGQAGADKVVLPKTGGSDTDTDTGSDTQTPAQTSEPAAEKAVTVNYTTSGFTPRTITVAAGGTITFVNQTDGAVEPSSDPHPVHTDNPQLNAGEIQPGASKTITVTTTGTWGIHNHFNHDQEMTVVVK